MSANTCYYSRGSQHKCCTHQHYCIFNKNRVKLEKQIGEAWRKYYDLKKLHDSYLKGYYTEDIDYRFLLKKIDLVKSNISRLVLIEKKIIDGDVNGYGFMDIETISTKTTAN